MSPKRKVNDVTEADPSVICKTLIQSRLHADFMFYKRTGDLDFFLSEMWAFNGALCAETEAELFISDVLMKKFYSFIYLFIHFD